MNHLFVFSKVEYSIYLVNQSWHHISIQTSLFSEDAILVANSDVFYRIDRQLELDTVMVDNRAICLNLFATFETPAIYMRVAYIFYWTDELDWRSNSWMSDKVTAEYDGKLLIESEFVEDKYNLLSNCNKEICHCCVINPNK